MGKPSRTSPPPIVALQGQPEYRLLAGWTAQHGGSPPAKAPRPALSLEGGRVRVYGDASPHAPGAATGPVYETASGDLAVPTGRVFVQLTPAADAARFAAGLEGIGYLLEERPSWAPNAAWIGPSSGGIAASLSNLRRLEALPGVARVEPEMLLTRVHR